MGQSAVKMGDVCETQARVPKFVDHQELHGRGAYRRLFETNNAVAGQTTAAERDLARFKQMHFCAHQLRRLRSRYGTEAEHEPAYQRYSAMHQRLREQIASDNLGLVYDMYKRTRIPNVDGDELLSDGMMALTRAIDTFNPWRGFRFTTYACSAIVRAFYRCRLKAIKRHQYEPLNFEAKFEKSNWLETRRSEESRHYAERLAKVLADGSVKLTETEREILTQRFPLDGDTRGRTLADIGRRMSLSKERVRQIQNTALSKLRRALA